MTWKGRPSTELPRRTFGYLPEERGLYPRMKVLDQLVFFAGLYGVPRKAAEKEVRDWLARFRVPEYADRRAEQLSKGNQQKIQFIAAILHDPEVLIMDEPFTGLDPVNVALLKAAFLEMRDRGKTLIFSTHQMDMAEELCDAIAIIDAGRLVASGADARREALDRQAGGPPRDRRRPRPPLAGRHPGRRRRPARPRLHASSRSAGRPTRRRSSRPPWPAASGSPASRSPTPRSSRSSSSGSGESAREDVSLAGIEDGPGAARAAAGAPTARRRAAARMNATLRNILAVARREFSVRARTRSFIIGTLFLAVAGAALALVPIGIRWFEGEGTTKIGVVDLRRPGHVLRPGRAPLGHRSTRAPEPEAARAASRSPSSPGEAAARAAVDIGRPRRRRS